MSLTARIPVAIALTRAAGTVPAKIEEVATVHGFLRVKGAPDFTLLASLPAAAQVTFVIPDISPGDYEFAASETDTQAPPVTSALSAAVAFTVPAPVVVQPALDPPTVGTPTEG